MMNLTTYQSLIEKVGVNNLDEANRDTYNIVKEGSDNFSDPALWNEMLIDADIKDAYELHTKTLQQLAKEHPKADMKVSPKDEPKKSEPSKKKVKAKAVKVKPKEEPRKAEVKQTPSKKARKKKAKRKAKVKKIKVQKVKAVQVKYPVTVKKFSKELQLIRRFANMDKKEKSLKSLQSFHHILSGMLSTDPDRKPILNEVFSRLTSLVEQAQAGAATHVKVKLEKSFKSDLISNIKSAQPKMKVEYLAGVQKKSPVVNGLSGPVNDGLFQGINSIDQNTKDTFRLGGAIGELLGDLETYKLAMSLEGDQGAGKTQFAFQLADAFADIGYSVGMFELEIGANSNIVTRFRDKYIHPDNQDKVAIAGEAPNGIDTVREYARKFGVIIIDSWTKLDVDSQEFDKLRNDFEDTIWIVLFQRTSANKIRGGTKPLYDAGINLEVIKADDTFVNNYAVATKNRYGQTGIKYNISSMRITA